MYCGNFGALGSHRGVLGGHCHSGLGLRVDNLSPHRPHVTTVEYNLQSPNGKYVGPCFRRVSKVKGVLGEELSGGWGSRRTTQASVNRCTLL